MEAVDRAVVVDVGAVLPARARAGMGPGVVVSGVVSEAAMAAVAGEEMTGVAVAGGTDPRGPWARASASSPS
jgi:hypothetical protein